MKKRDLAKRIARTSKISKATAADRIDSVVHKILQNLRSGQKASLPGLGTLTPGPKPRFLEETTGKESKKKSD